MSGAPSEHVVLQDYLKGFQRAEHPWPALPLQSDPSLEWWRDLLANRQPSILLVQLQQQFPQLLLQQVPDVRQSEYYKALVLRGKRIEPDQLIVSPSWDCPQQLQLSIAEHPCGGVPVLRTPSWTDLHRLVFALAHRCEPIPLANSVHAQAVSGLIHWGLSADLGIKRGPS